MHCYLTPNPVHEMTDEKKFKDEIAMAMGNPLTRYSILNDEHRLKVDRITAVVQQSLSESERKREEAVKLLSEIETLKLIIFLKDVIRENEKDAIDVVDMFRRVREYLSAQDESFLKQQEG